MSRKEQTRYALPEFERMDRELAVPKEKKAPRTCVCCGAFLPRNCIPTTVVLAGVEHGPFCHACMGYEPTVIHTLSEDEQAILTGMPLSVEALGRQMEAMRRGYMLLSPGVLRWFNLDDTPEQQQAFMDAMRAKWQAGQPWPYQVHLGVIEAKKEAA